MLILENIKKSCIQGSASIAALSHISMHIEPGEYVSITGNSGIGKLSLFNIITGMDTDYSGQMYLAGECIKKLSNSKLAKLRLRNIGCLSRSGNLIARFNVLQNLELPMIYAGSPPEIRWNRCRKILNLVGMQDCMFFDYEQLSETQRQGISIARALVNNPQLLVAYEPTYYMDSMRRNDLLNLFMQLHNSGKTIIHLTHDRLVAGRARRTVCMHNGKIISDTAN